MHAELDKLRGVVQEFQQQFEGITAGDDDSELPSLPPAAVVEAYVKDVSRIVCGLAETDIDEIDKSDVDQQESLAATALTLRKENESLRRSVERMHAEKQNMEQQLTSVEEMITLARELKEENQGLIRDFRGLKDRIDVEQQADAHEIAELTKSFKELITDNEMLRRENEQRLIELAISDTQHRLTASSSLAEARALNNAVISWEKILDKSTASYPVVVKSSQVTLDQNAAQTKKTSVEVWKKTRLDSDKPTQTQKTDHEVLGATNGECLQLKTPVEDKKASRDSTVAKLMSGVRRKNDEIGRLHQNVQRMDRVLGQMTRTTPTTEEACPSTDHQELIVRKTTRRSVCRVKSTGNAGVDNSDVGQNKRDREITDNVESANVFPPLESEAAAVNSAPCKWVSRQTSMDSGVSRDRSFREHDNSGSSLGDSGLLQLSLLQSQPPGDAELGGPASWQHLIAENSYLRSELDKLMTSPAASGEDDSGKTASQQQSDRTAQPESEIAALTRTVKEQSAYLQVRYPDDSGDELQAWAQPYDYNGMDVNGSELHTTDDDGKGTTVAALRRQNALLEHKLKEMTLKWNEYETSVQDQTNSQLQLETARLHDRQQSALLDELAAKTRQIEDLEKLSRHQTTALQKTVDEVANSYWSVLEDLDNRRTLMLGNNVDFDSRTPNEEKTTQVFSRRLEGWLKDYQALLRKTNNVQRLNGDLSLQVSSSEDKLDENTDDAATDNLRHCRVDRQSLLANVNKQLDYVNGAVAKLKIPAEQQHQQQQQAGNALVTNPEQLEGELKKKEPKLSANHEKTDRLQLKTDLEQAQLTVVTFSEKVDRLTAELKTKEEDIRRKNEEIDEIRVENEALQVAALSSSALIASDCEEQLVTEIERLTFDRSMLQQRLQEAEYELEETREELAGENEELQRQLDGVRQSAADNKAQAEKTADVLATENQKLRNQLSRREAEFRSAEESLRSTEERAMVENGRLHSELVLASAERSQLRENCAKLENDCLAFQELSNEMIEHCKRLSIELERLRRRSTSGGSGIANTQHEDCQRTADQAQRQIQSLTDENKRLTLALETERKRKNFTEPERLATIDDQTDTARDMELSEIQSDNDSHTQRLKQGVSHTRGKGGEGEKELMMSQLVGHAQAARGTALQLRRLLNAEYPSQINGKAGKSSVAYVTVIPYICKKKLTSLQMCVRTIDDISPLKQQNFRSGLTTWRRSAIFRR